MDNYDSTTKAGGLGLRTSINTSTDANHLLATFGTSPQLANQLSSFATQGNQTGPLGLSINQTSDAMGQLMAGDTFAVPTPR